MPSTSGRLVLVPLTPDQRRNLRIARDRLKAVAGELAVASDPYYCDTCDAQRYRHLEHARLANQLHGMTKRLDRFLGGREERAHPIKESA